MHVILGHVFAFRGRHMLSCFCPIQRPVVDVMDIFLRERRREKQVHQAGWKRGCVASTVGIEAAASFSMLPAYNHSNPILDRANSQYTDGPDPIPVACNRVASTRITRRVLAGAGDGRQKTSGRGMATRKPLARVVTLVTMY